MSIWKNVSGNDLDLRVDGHPFAVDEGETVTLPDEFDYQVADQPTWELVSAVQKSAPVAAFTPEPVLAPTPEPVPASEGDN